MDNVPQEKFRKSLRNAAINYRNGYFFVTCQVAHNKSIFGTIVGERCELNSIGRHIHLNTCLLQAFYISCRRKGGMDQSFGMI